MKVGKALNDFRKSEGLTQENFAHDLHISKQLVSHIEQGRRKLHKDVAQSALKEYDNPKFTLNLLHEFSDGVTSPSLDGSAVDFENHLAVLFKAKKETQEAFEVLDMELFLKRPDLATEAELEKVDVVLKELVECKWWQDNLIAVLADAYNRSSKSISRSVKTKWKATEVIT